MSGLADCRDFDFVTSNTKHGAEIDEEDQPDVHDTAIKISSSNKSVTEIMFADTAIKLTIRPRHDRDLPVLKDVLAEVYEEDGYPVEGVAEAVAWLTPPNTVISWVAEIRSDIPPPDPTDPAPASDTTTILHQNETLSGEKWKIVGHVMLTSATSDSERPSNNQVSFDSSNNDPSRHPTTANDESGQHVNVEQQETHHNQSTMDVARLFVAPPFRCAGIGRRLTETVMTYASSHGAKLKLLVLDRNQAAGKMYRKLGWRHLYPENYQDTSGGIWTGAAYGYF